jgi:hypothetical protein
MGRTSLVVLCSRHLGMSRHWFPRVDTPQVGVVQLSSKVPPRVGTVSALLYSFVSAIGPGRPPGRPGGRLCARGNAEGPIGTSPTL